ncbi:MAG TPA: DUF5691 domain-containing protein [Aggregatilineales bacterium]|nr:hypothetical protein [Anaerolineales bacterium]HRE48135.1 DUF5691 domain-containing protein [Aggregatilineales bacterium]
MTTWDDLVTRALLGIRRQEHDNASLSGEDEGALAGFLERMPLRTAGDLLRRAAVVSLHRRAGRYHTLEDFPWKTFADAPTETRPYPPKQVFQHLRQMLSGTFREALSECLKLMDREGMRIPEEFLPAIFEMGNQEKLIQDALSPSLLGERGQWLMHHNPEKWMRFAKPFDHDLWTHGKSFQRQMQLAALRRTDPHHARELLASVWDKEPAKTRKEFLGTFQTNLSAADEDFLERILDDKDNGVQLNAATLLGKLPESAFVGRMIARTANIFALYPVNIETTLAYTPPAVQQPFSGTSRFAPQPVISYDAQDNTVLRKILYGEPTVASSPFPTRPLGSPAAPAKPDVRPVIGTPPPHFLALIVPNTLDESMKRDGIGQPTGNFPPDRLSGKEAWVRRMIDYVPPRVWRERFGMTSLELIRAALVGHAAAIVLTGWQNAALLYDDADMAEGLLESGFLYGGGNFMLNGGGLIKLLSPQKREDMMWRVIRRQNAPMGADKHTFSMLDGCIHAWSAPFTAFILEEIIASLLHPNRPPEWSRRRVLGNNSPVSSWLDNWGLFMDPQTPHDMMPYLTTSASKMLGDGEAFQKLIKLLTFRYELQHTLGERGSS